MIPARSNEKKKRIPHAKHTKMPKEIKKRGRRAEKKRKEERGAADELEQNANYVPITGQTAAAEEEEAEAAYYGDGG